MAEGKTNMFGKTYNTIGSTDSNFIIKTKGDLKVQWGNKYIDVIKNGKIASEGSKLLFIIDNPDEIKQNGLYLINSTEGAEVWLNIDGTKVNLSGGENGTTYISYMTEQQLTSDQQHQAMSNIGFYYKDIDSAKQAHIISGIIYVENENKLYIAKDGSLIEYTIQQKVQGNTEVAQGEIHPLYIAEYSLWVNKVEYIRCSSNAIYLLQQVFVYDTIQSDGANETTGYRLYMDKGYSVLEIDYIKWRKYPMPIKHAELLKKIEYKELNPKMYYNITDFQNPWQVTWSEEPFLYDNTYEEINKINHLSGVENALELIVKAKSREELEEQAWSIKYPDWIIHYDPFFKGPEHKVMEGGEEVIYYGFRTQDIETVLEDGTIKKTTTYLPCRGQITYLKDEFGNEGNFNFRQYMFKHTDCWRYCVDKYPVDPTNYLGEFLECYNNVFNFEQLEINVQVFKFNEVLDSSNNVTGYTIEAIDSDKILTKGHHLYINGTTINNNVFNLDNYQKDIILQHTITSDVLENNSFIKIKKPITCSQNLKSNYFEGIEGELNIQAACSDNTVVNIKSNVVIQAGTQFDRNKIFNFNQWLDNTKIFIENTINGCSGSLTNKGTMSQNNINAITGTLINEAQMANNNIETVKDLNNTKNFENNDITTITNIVNTNTISDNIFITVDNINNSGFIQENIIDYIKSLENSGTFTNNTINSINATLTNKKTISNNIIGDIATDLVNIDYTIQGNNISYIDTLTVNGNIQSNTIINLINTNINSDVSNNNATTISDCQFDDFCTDNIFREGVRNCKFGIFTDNKAYKELNDCIFTAGNINSTIFNKTINKLTVSDTMQGCIFNYINDLVLDKPVYYTTFHGSIGNITRKLTDYEWVLLQDSTKKTDAYPNIQVVCVPEIIQAGMILMWYSANPIPKGWAICDGSNNTPDLRNRFIRGINTDGSGNITEKSEELNPSDITLEIDSASGKSISKLELKKENIPNHEHPHYHTIPSISNTVEIDDDYAYGKNSGTAASGTDINVEEVLEASGTESITITIPDTDQPTYTEGELKDTPDKITIEPKSYIMIFIMKIDENPTV